MFPVKTEIRILGIDDLPFTKQESKVGVIGTVFRGGDYMDGLLSTQISIDGSDGTQNLISMIDKSRTFGQLRAVMLDGVTLGGFNVVDIEKIWQKTKLPVIVVTRDKPNLFKIKYALFKHFKDGVLKWQSIEKAGEVFEHQVTTEQAKGTIYFQFKGMELEEVRKILNLTIKHGLIPEPIRVAHLIGQGLKFGESKGRA